MMVTRTFCDHCGCETPHLTMYCFGARSLLQTVQHVYVNQGNNLLGGAGNYNYQTPVFPPALTPIPMTTSTSASVKSLDLCPVCEPIWMRRVEKLATTTE